MGNLIIFYIKIILFYILFILFLGYSFYSGEPRDHR